MGGRGRGVDARRRRRAQPVRARRRRRARARRARARPAVARRASSIRTCATAPPPCCARATSRWPPRAPTSAARTSSTRAPASRPRACSRSPSSGPTSAPPTPTPPRPSRWASTGPAWTAGLGDYEALTILVRRPRAQHARRPRRRVDVLAGDAPVGRDREDVDAVPLELAPVVGVRRARRPLAHGEVVADAQRPALEAQRRPAREDRRDVVADGRRAVHPLRRGVVVEDDRRRRASTRSRRGPGAFHAAS